MLKITDIGLRNFRSYEEFSLHDLGDLTILVGPNASGKTNAIEAVELLTALSSFRSATSAELLHQGESQGRIQADITDGNRRLEVSMSLASDGESQPTFDTEPGDAGARSAKVSRRYALNGKPKQTRDLRGILPSVTFTPDDLNLAKGSDRHRRRELDLLGSQLNANYHQLLRDYDKVLRQKNRLLKDEAPQALVEATNEVFLKVAMQLSNYREALFDRLVPHVAGHYRDISGAAGEELTARYVRTLAPGGGGDGSIAPGDAEGARSSLRDEMASKRTLVGPHLDKVHLYIDGLDSRTYASQGQQRSIVLALKLAEAQVIEEMLDQLPVLLLDDVMSELDGARREALVQELLQGKQTFITTANIDYFDDGMLNRAQVIELGTV